MKKLQPEEAEKASFSAEMTRILKRQNSYVFHLGKLPSLLHVSFLNCKVWLISHLYLYPG